MTEEKMLQVIGIYRNHLLGGSGRIRAKEFPHGEFRPSSELVLRHLVWMLDQMEGFVREGKRDKAFRWLGFVQGCLWMHGLYSLEEMRNHNRPQ